MKRFWNSRAAKAAPIGAATFLALTAIAACGAAFDLLAVLPNGFLGRYAILLSLLLAVAYLLFPPAVACTIYSALFESSSVLGLAGLALAALIGVHAWFTVTVFLDGLLLLPFWFLAVMGIIRFVKWRQSRRTQLATRE